MNNLDDLKNFLSDKKIKKIFLLCGHKSFSNSGAKDFINNNLKEKE